MWIAAVQRKDWEPNEYSWLCSAHLLPERKVTTSSLGIMLQQSLRTLAISPLKRKAQVNLKSLREEKKSKRTRLTDETTRETYCNSCMKLI